MVADGIYMLTSCLGAAHYNISNSQLLRCMVLKSDMIMIKLQT